MNMQQGERFIDDVNESYDTSRTSLLHTHTQQEQQQQQLCTPVKKLEPPRDTPFLQPSLQPWVPGFKEF